MTTPQEPVQKPQNLLVKTLVPAVVILGLVIGGLFVVKSQVGHAPAEQPAGAAAALPDFQLTQYQGKTLKFSELGKKVVLLNFWATWCEACVVEMPSIVKLRQAYKDKGFEVVAVDVDDKPEAVLAKSMKELGIDFTVYTDPDQKLTELFGVHAIPLTVILDKDRKVLFARNGEYDWNQPGFRSQLEGWLAK